MTILTTEHHHIPPPQHHRSQLHNLSPLGHIILSIVNLCLIFRNIKIIIATVSGSLGIALKPLPIAWGHCAIGELLCALEVLRPGFYSKLLSAVSLCPVCGTGPFPVAVSW